MKKLLIVMAFALSGCAAGSNAGPTAVTPATLPANVAAHSNGNGRYIYLSDYGSSTLYVVSYKTGDLLGSTNAGISGPQGLCSDTDGNTFLVNTNDSNILEYKAPSTTSDANASDSGYYPAGCSVSTTGDLAVSNLCNAPSCDGGGSVSIYKGATGSPSVVTCPNISRAFFDTYDDRGNLFVDGENSSYAFSLCEVPNGKSEGIAITLDSAPQFPGSAQWDGRYVAIADQDAGTIDRYKVHGHIGALKGTVTLAEYGDGGFIMDGKKAIVGVSGASNSYSFWRYPKGGKPYTTRQTAYSELIGIAISPARKL